MLNLHPQNRSGIRATVAFLDNGETLMILGTATGLDPNEVYISLIYDVASRPGGPTACEPAILIPRIPASCCPRCSSAPGASPRTGPAP